MEGVLGAMTGVRLYALPDVNPWTLDTFVHNNWLTCCQASQVLFELLVTSSGNMPGIVLVLFDRESNVSFSICRL